MPSLVTLTLIPSSLDPDELHLKEVSECDSCSSIQSLFSYGMLLAELTLRMNPPIGWHLTMTKTVGATHAHLWKCGMCVWLQPEG